MTAPLDLACLSQWIGREDIAEDIITPSLVERFHATLGLSGAPARQGEIAPNLIHFCVCQSATEIEELGLDGHPARGGFLPPVPLPRRMWAASAIDFHRALRVGDHVRRRSRIAEVTAKTGRSGMLCFVTVDHEIFGNSALAVSERQTIVYREASSGEPRATPILTAPGAVMEAVEASATLLFRYSALTFNAHRIHYDRNYATREEGYPGLVVHGPLQATLLVHLASRCHDGRMPDRFTFRGISPAFDGAPLGLHAGTATANVLDLWTTRADGQVAMQATAEWR